MSTTYGREILLFGWEDIITFFRTFLTIVFNVVGAEKRTGKKQKNLVMSGRYCYLMSDNPSIWISTQISQLVKEKSFNLTGNVHLYSGSFALTSCDRWLVAGRSCRGVNGSEDSAIYVLCNITELIKNNGPCLRISELWQQNVAQHPAQLPQTPAVSHGDAEVVASCATNGHQHSCPQTAPCRPPCL